MKGFLSVVLALVVLVAAGPAYAVDLYSAGLLGSGNFNHICLASNKGTSNINVTMNIYNAVSGLPVQTCPLFLVEPGKIRFCQFTGFNYLTFCKVSTSSSTNTRATHSIYAFGTSAATSSTPVR